MADRSVHMCKVLHASPSLQGYHVETVKVEDDRKIAPGRLDLQIAAAAGGAANGSGLWAQLEAAKQADAAAAYDKKASLLRTL